MTLRGPLPTAGLEDLPVRVERLRSQLRDELVGGRSVEGGLAPGQEDPRVGVVLPDLPHPGDVPAPHHLVLAQPTGGDRHAGLDAGGRGPLPRVHVDHHRGGASLEQREDLAQRRDADAGDLGRRHRPDVAVDAPQPPERVVVQDDAHAVLGGLDVDLDDVGTAVEGRPDRGDGVLPVGDRVAPVSDGERPRVLPGPRQDSTASPAPRLLFGQQPSGSTGSRATLRMSVGSVPEAPDDRVEHRLGQLARERVLLADVVAPHQPYRSSAGRGEHGLGPVGEPRFRSRHGPAEAPR